MEAADSFEIQVLCILSSIPNILFSMDQAFHYKTTMIRVADFTGVLECWSIG